jgi:hypothetical protein
MFSNLRVNGTQRFSLHLEDYRVLTTSLSKGQYQKAACVVGNSRRIRRTNFEDQRLRAEEVSLNESFNSSEFCKFGQHFLSTFYFLSPLLV